MKILSLEDYSRINETVIGLRNTITKDDISQLTEDEFQNLIRFLLLQSTNDAGMLESLEVLKNCSCNPPSFSTCSLVLYLL